MARPAISLLAGLLTVSLAAALPARAAEIIHVGNDAPTSIPNCAIDIGIARGIFLRHGLDVQPSIFFGASKGQPALIGGAIDVMVGAGSEMAFIAKGAPELAVAVVSGRPADMALVVADSSNITSPAQLKGRKLGISNPGGLTDWLAHQVMRSEGIAPTDIALISAGNTPTATAMLRTGGLDAAVMDSVSAYTLESKGGARVLQTFGPSVPDFAQGVVYARTDFISAHPDQLRALLAAWFEALDVVVSDKPTTVACILTKVGGDQPVAERVFELVRSEVSPNGRFEPKAMAVLAQSFVDMGVLPEKPDMAKLYTEAYLPAR